MELRHEKIWFWNIHFSFTHISYTCPHDPRLSARLKVIVKNTFIHVEEETKMNGALAKKRTSHEMVSSWIKSIDDIQYLIDLNLFPSSLFELIIMVLALFLDHLDSLEQKRCCVSCVTNSPESSFHCHFVAPKQQRQQVAHLSVPLRHRPSIRHISRSHQASENRN